MKTWILLFCLLLASCGGRQAQFSDHEDFYWIDFRPLVKNEALEVGLNEWGTNPRYVQLETNEFIQIKFIQRVILDGDKFLVVHSDRLSLFDKDGKYQYDIGEKGEEEGEYFRMGGVVLRNDTLFVVDGNYDFTLYNWQGEYLGKWFQPKIRHTMNFFLVPNTDLFLGHVNNFTGQKKVRFVFFRDTTAIKTIPVTEKLEPASPMVVYSIPTEMKAFDGLVPAFKEVFNDTIYQVDESLNLVPYAVVELGKYKATKEAMFACTAEQLMKKWDFFNGKIALAATGEKDGIIYLAHHDVTDPYTYSYDKNTHQTFYQKVIYPDNSYGFKEGSTFVPHFISTDGKYLIDYEIPENGNNPVIVLVER